MELQKLELPFLYYYYKTNNYVHYKNEQIFCLLQSTLESTGDLDLTMRVLVNMADSLREEYIEIEDGLVEILLYRALPLVPDLVVLFVKKYFRFAQRQEVIDYIFNGLVKYFIFHKQQISKTLIKVLNSLSGQVININIQRATGLALFCSHKLSVLLRENLVELDESGFALKCFSDPKYYERKAQLAEIAMGMQEERLAIAGEEAEVDV